MAHCLLPKISGVEVTPSVTSVESSEQFWRICEPWVALFTVCNCAFCYMIHRTKKEEWRHRRGPKEEKAKSKEEKTTNAEKDWGKQGIFFNIQASITSF